MSKLTTKAGSDPRDSTYAQMIIGQLIRTALDLKLPDIIGDQPASGAEIAAAAGANPELVSRVLRALAGVGIFRAVGGDRFAHNESSAGLRSAVDGVPTILGLFNAEWMWRLWDRFTDAVRTGESPFTKVYGKHFFDYMSEDAPELGETFNAVMTSQLSLANESIVEALELSTAGKLVDVGGGQGSLVRDLLRHNKNLRGVLFDIESALAGADPELRSGPLARRCEIIAGDARRSVPEGADVYLFRGVLHNWDDESCVRMLSSCARAGTSGARVFVIEAQRDDTIDQSPTVSQIDLLMFLLLGSKVRSEAEHAELFERAGLSYLGTRPTAAAPFSVVEATLS